MTDPLKPVIPQPGRPLYLTVKETVREAIDAGHFRPGQQIPSTKQLSKQLAVSLVTAHRALQELVSAGVLQRTQGKGTFVHGRYAAGKPVGDLRIGLVFPAESSLADYYCGQILQGIWQAIQPPWSDLLLLPSGEDLRSECTGLLYISPPSSVAPFTSRSLHKHPLVIIGAPSPIKAIPSITVDNVDLARRGVDYLVAQGHRRVGFVGEADGSIQARDRWHGFLDACETNDIPPPPEHAVRCASGKPSV